MLFGSVNRPSFPPINLRVTVALTTAADRTDPRPVGTTTATKSNAGLVRRQATTILNHLQHPSACRGVLILRGYSRNGVARSSYQDTERNTWQDQRTQQHL